MEKKPYSHSGYSWMEMIPEKENPLRLKEELERDCDLIERGVQEIDARLQEFRHFCHRLDSELVDPHDLESKVQEIKEIVHILSKVLTK